MSSIEHVQPPELFPSKKFGYTQVVKASGTHVFLSGQTAFDKDGKVTVGADLEAQASAALENLGHALRSVGATPSDLTALRIYVANYEPEMIGVLGPPLAKFLAGAEPPAQTLLGVQALALPDLLIEIEASAVLPD